MPKKNHSWGVEVGSNAIKAVHLVRQGQDVVLDDFEVVQFKKVLTTPEIDAEQIVQESLSKLLNSRDMRRSNVILSVPGSAAFAKFAKLPPVDPKKIPDIVKFEAVQQIPFPIEQVEWDYQVFPQPDSPDVEVGIFAITKDRVEQFLSSFASVGLPADGLTLSALAVYNAMAYDMDLEDDAQGLILMDIGTVNTDVIITRAGRLWLRTLPIGGNNFTEALVRAFKLSFSKAEKLKREGPTSKYSRQIFQAMRPVFSDLIQEVQRTIGFYQTLDPQAQITKLVGMGSSFRLPGMQKFLRQQLQIEIVRLDTFKKITAEQRRAADFSEHTVSLATAYGLALQGLGLERVHANILPAAAIKQRVWRKKQPWFAVAAAMMVVASSVAWLRLQIDKSQFNAALKESQSRIESTMSRANQYVGQWRSLEGGADPRRRIENLRRILDYRELWPMVLQDITQAAKSMQTQPELLESNYQAIQEIPRSQRRRVYVEEVTAQYQFQSQDARPGHQRPPGLQTMTTDQIWGTADKTSTTDTPVSPPAFVITLKGSTPYRDGPKLISQSFIKWLEDHRQQAGRPYRVVVTKGALRRIEKMREADLRSQNDRDADTPASRRQASNQRRQNADLVIDRETMDLLLPSHPLAEEPRVGDWTFEIQWTIELLRPEAVRQVQGLAS